MNEIRLLHRNSQYGYTARMEMALPSEPEAISEEEQRVISLQARAEFAEARREENRRRDNRQWLDRLKKAEMRADSAGVDIFRHQSVIRKQILAIEQRLSGRGTFLGGTLASA